MISLTVAAQVRTQNPYAEMMERFGRGTRENELQMIREEREITKTILLQQTLDVEIEAIAQNHKRNLTFTAKPDKPSECPIEKKLFNEPLDLIPVLRFPQLRIPS